MNREDLSRIAHANHPIKSPLDDETVRGLLEHGIAHGEARVLDLGCGSGEWLLRALTAHPGLRAEGVDVSADALRQAREAAERLGVQDRLALHQVEAASFRSPQPFDLVLSVGSAHAFGGLLPTLAGARKHLAPEGRVLIGDGFWEREPSPEAVEMLGDFTDLATTVERVTAEGWAPIHGHISTRRELDDYEWANWGSLASWALDHPEDSEVLEYATTRRTEWLRGYRDSFGFLTLVLRAV